MTLRGVTATPVGLEAALSSGMQPAAPARSTAGAAPAKGIGGGAAVQFENVMLQTFVEAMLPKSGGAFFGKGAGGDVWRSFLAKDLAQTMTQRGGLGLASNIARSLHERAVAGAVETGGAAAATAGGDVKGR
jgi:Rod binding domain-containing protein